MRLAALDPERVAWAAREALADSARVDFKTASNVELATVVCGLRVALRQMLEVHNERKAAAS